MPDNLTTIRARAAAHAEALEAQATFLTVRELAARWHVSEATVRAIPRERLPFTAIGRGATRVHRRYNPADVERYERGEAQVA